MDKRSLLKNLHENRACDQSRGQSQIGHFERMGLANLLYQSQVVPGDLFEVLDGVGASAELVVWIVVCHHHSVDGSQPAELAVGTSFRHQLTT